MKFSWYVYTRLYYIYFNGQCVLVTILSIHKCGYKEAHLVALTSMFPEKMTCGHIRIQPNFKLGVP